MLSHDIGPYRLVVSEMSHKSHLALSTWFSEWILSDDARDKLASVSAISTKVILSSRLSLYRNGEKLPDGTYEIDDGVTITLPLTEACLIDLPVSVVAWLIDAAGQENATTLQSFLAGTRQIAARQMRTRERLSDSGRFNRSTPH